MEKEDRLNDESEAVQNIYKKFLKAIRNLIITGILCILIGLLWVISAFLYDEQSIHHAITACMLGSLIISVVGKRYWKKNSSLFALFIGYLLFVIIQYITLGLPQSFIPYAFEAEIDKLNHVLSSINDFTPFLYYVIELSGLVFLARVIYLRKGLDIFPQSIKNELGIL